MAKSRKSSQQQRTGSANCVLRLYVNDLTPRSRLAIANIRAICSKYLSGRHELTIIDIFHHPQVAKEQQIVAAPTLLRTWPLPQRRLIGDFSNQQKVLAALDLATVC